MNHVPVTTVLAATALLVATAGAAEKPRNRPELFNKVIDCRSITENAQRLACYDQTVGALEAAEQRKDVVVVDREQMRETRKSLFGFTLPKIGLFGGGKEEVDEEDVSEIQTSIGSVRQIASDRWSLVLPDAGTWETMTPVKYEPRAGQKIRISKALMGSYLGSFGSNKGVRFRRVD